METKEQPKNTPTKKVFIELADGRLYYGLIGAVSVGSASIYHCARASYDEDQGFTHESVPFAPYVSFFNVVMVIESVL